MKISSPLMLILFLLTTACAAPPATTMPVPPTLAPATVTEAHPGPELILMQAGYGTRGDWYEIYFTDPTSPYAAQQTGGPDLALAEAIDSARLSVDMAIYSLSSPRIRDALLRAHRRGVAVRLVMESDNRDRDAVQTLLNAGIPVLGDRREGLMHNKFVIIDHSEVWTGSMNFTTNGTYKDNNNLIRIRSVKIAQNFSQEFDEMFVQDKFGPDTLRATPNPVITVEGTRIETFFSPDDTPSARVEELLSQAQESIYFLAYSFTSDPLGEAIRLRGAQGVNIAGVMEAEQVGSNVGTEYDLFALDGLDVRLDGNQGQMHHKVIIIDRKIVITGSYNFSQSAETRNDENLLIIHSAEIARPFIEEFQRVFRQGLQ